MKKNSLILLVISLQFCQQPEVQYQILNDSEWFETLQLALAFGSLAGNEVNLYQYYENEELADEIIRLLKDDKLREHYSRMSMERSKRYTQVEVVRDIEKVYSVLCKEDI